MEKNMETITILQFRVQGRSWDPISSSPPNSRVVVGC